MSDLQCAVRIFVARHGQAEYETDLLGDFGGSLTPAGRQQSRALADLLATERVSQVWTSAMARAVQTAEIAAARLGLGVVVREGLVEIGVGDHAGSTGVPDPFAVTFAAWARGDLDARIRGGQSGREVVGRFSAVLEEIADTHRGESVLVVSHGGVMSLALAHLARNLRGDHALGLQLGSCEVVRLDGDADGWVARSWAGAAVAGKHL